MSSSIQNKLLSIEVPPPPGVWDKIAAELDDSELEHQYPSKLYELTVLPPAGVWEKIAGSLDAALPAATAAAKLMALEIAPPATTWNKIKTSLDAELEAAIPEQRRFSPLWRYAAAAAIIGLIAWSGINLLNSKKQQTLVAKQEPPLLPEKTDTPVTTREEVAINEPTVSSDKIATTESDDARNDAALEASKKTFAKLDISHSSKIKEAANFYFGKMASSGTTRGLNIGSDDDDAIPTYTKEADRYIILMTPDGNIIRMSKKLSSMICCVSGEEQDEDCKDQMKKWREKMANSAAGHSPGNLMDILGLLNSLQDDENF